MFKDDRELLKWSLDVLKGSNDPDDLICSQTKTFSRSDLKYTTDDELKRLIEDSHAFCASFQDLQETNNDKTVDSSPMDVDEEVSSF